MKIRKAVFPAAGLGTRFLPATKSQPKEMLPLVDKPVIQYVIEEAMSSGIEDIIIVISMSAMSWKRFSRAGGRQICSNRSEPFRKWSLSHTYARKRHLD
jgi:dTDP-glucose pyrophosphorylase